MMSKSRTVAALTVAVLVGTPSLAAPPAAAEPLGARACSYVVDTDLGTLDAATPGATPTLRSLSTGDPARRVVEAEASPRGDRLAATLGFVDSELVIADAAARWWRVVDDGAGAHAALAWSDAGDALAWSVYADGRWQLRVSGLNGIGAPRVLYEMASALPPDRFVSTPARIDEIAWSPDGTLLAFTVDRAAAGRNTDVVVVPVAGGDAQVLTADAANRVVNDGLTWSSDGRLAWWRREHFGAATTLRIVVDDPSDATPPLVVAKDDETDWGRETVSPPLEWSPSGSYLAFHDVARLYWPEDTTVSTTDVVRADALAPARYTATGNFRAWVDADAFLIEVDTAIGSVFFPMPRLTRVDVSGVGLPVEQAFTDWTVPSEAQVGESTTYRWDNASSAAEPGAGDDTVAWEVLEKTSMAAYLPTFPFPHWPNLGDDVSPAVRISRGGVVEVIEGAINPDVSPDGGFVALLTLDGTSLADLDADVVTPVWPPGEYPRAIGNGRWAGNCDLPAVTRTTTFTDVSGEHPFVAPITGLAERDVIGGYADGTFRPAGGVSRLALTTLLWRMAGSPEVTVALPADVPADHPSASAVRWALGAGILGGYGDGTFRLASPVSRQALVAALWRWAGELDPVVPAPFVDVPPGHLFGDAIAWGAAEGLVTGDDATGTFRPVDPLTRQALAAVLFRYWERPSAHG